MPNSTGSLLGFNLDGIDFLPAADAEANIQHQRWKSERQAHPGGSSEMKTIQICNAENIVLILQSPTELDILKSLNERLDSSVKCTIKMVDGSTFKSAAGSFEITDNYNTKNGRVTLRYDCENEWEIFGA